jgi:Replication initiator protein A
MMFMLAEPIEQTGALAPSRPGKDEMNFAEFPIALLTDRVPKGQKSIKFEDQIYDEKRKKLVTRKRVIEGSEEYGLPTATDDTVVLALIQLTKQKSDFQRREVEFSRLELIRMLGWPNEGKSYDRIKLSLTRIANVTYNYDNAWWDPRQKKWTTKIFHIIDTVEINDSRASDSQRGLFPSRIVWNEVVFDSFEAGFLRNIDFQLCMRLEHPTALRMYRFLGKRFYQKPEWTFDLKEFAYDHIGLGRNYEGGTQIARKLQPAIVELESVGFIEPLVEDERFQKKGRDWSIRFVQKSALLLAAAPVADLPPEPAPPPVVVELTQRGLTRSKAVELAARYPADFIEGKIEQFDWKMTQPKPPKKPAGYLFKSIEDAYAADPNFVSRAERQAREETARQAERATAAARREEQEQQDRDREARRKVDAYLKQLDQAERIVLEAEALAAASPANRESYESHIMARFRDTLMIGMIRDYLAGKPELEQIAAQA